MRLKIFLWTIGLSLNGILWTGFLILVCDYNDYLHHDEGLALLITVPILLCWCSLIALLKLRLPNRLWSLRLASMCLLYPIGCLAIGRLFGSITEWPAMSIGEYTRTQGLGLDCPVNELWSRGDIGAENLPVENPSAVTAAFRHKFASDPGLRFRMTDSGFELLKNELWVYQVVYSKRNDGHGYDAYTKVSVASD